MAKCKDCGFLAKHVVDANWSALPKYFELSQDERQGTVSERHSPTAGGLNYLAEPACFRGEFPISEEIVTSQAGGRSFSEAARDVIGEERDCSKWFIYSPDLSPGQHLEEFKLEGARRTDEKTRNVQLAIAGLQLLVAGVGITVAVLVALVLADETSETPAAAETEPAQMTESATVPMPSPVTTVPSPVRGK